MDKVKIEIVDYACSDVKKKNQCIYILNSIAIKCMLHKKITLEITLCKSLYKMAQLKEGALVRKWLIKETKPTKQVIMVTWG